MAGFFKKLAAGAKSLTKMIAIKNVTKVATGQFGDLAMEAASRTIKPFMAGGGVPNDKKNAVGNAAITGVTSFARSMAGQTNATVELGKFGSDIADASLKAMWDKYKTKILVGIGLIIGAIVLIPKLFNKKTTTSRRRY